MFTILSLSFLLGVCSYSFWKGKHALLSLLILESMMLLALLLVIFTFSFTIGEMGIFLLILTLSVAEAALGLALLVVYLKTYSKDLLTNESVLLFQA
uniref:NADH dehydrogenase subunit 4L n=1 Tax=Formosana swinhoei TaxID=1290014 RepID=A0A347Z6H8_9EUPU|nr:NADH dehydrogenase subunit 4L [Formosana swinhoei]